VSRASLLSGEKPKRRLGVMRLKALPSPAKSKRGPGEGRVLMALGLSTEAGNTLVV